MKSAITVLLGIALLAGCSGGGNNTATNAPPVEPPVEPDPPAMQSFAAFAAFARQVYADDADATPREVNDKNFNQDADDDDFSDLLQ